MKIFPGIIIIVLFFFIHLSASHSQVSYNDLIKSFTMVNGKWEGTLTYMDYSTGKPYEMPANAELSRIDSTGKFILHNIYPNEPGANSLDTITLSNDGKYIDDEPVISLNEENNGNVTVITEKQGKDGNENKNAIIRVIYTFGKNEFIRKKEVKFTGETAWITRHEYKYKLRKEN